MKELSVAGVFSMLNSKRAKGTSYELLVTGYGVRVTRRMAHGAWPMAHDLRTYDLTNLLTQGLRTKGKGLWVMEKIVGDSYW
ncbi:hypothetical protein DCC77_03510 [Candidatus Uhrbacteria bacterium]|nr:MAG: hypothetical protein DCC77_03510 [Candidatus Uhrbacteria bacterium]